MRSSVFMWLALVLGAHSSGCTFYTACPTGSGPANGSGGTGAGGAANPTGGSGPLLEGEWVRATGNLSHMPSECGNLSFGTAKTDEDMIITGVAQHGLWASTDGGGSWKPLGSSADPVQITNRATSILFDPDDSNTFWENGVYNDLGVFKTTDDGKSFSAQGQIRHNDYLSVDFSDPKRRTLLASGHEQVHELYLSVDAAKTWSEIGDYIPSAPKTCPYPHIIDSQTFLLGCGSYGGGTTGIFRSTDGGVNWDQVSKLGGGAPPVVMKDGSIYWATEASGGLTKSTDNGITWSDALGAGVVSTPGGGVRPWQMPDGRIAELGQQSIIISDDDGVTWKPASAALPYTPVGFYYAAQQKAFFVYYITCNVGTDAVPADGIMRFDFDYETQ